MSDQVKIVMLAGQGESSTLMYNGIREDFKIEKLIIESSLSKLSLLRRRVKRLGYAKVLGQVLFMIFNVFLKRLSKRRIKEIIEVYKLNEHAENDIASVSSINSEEVICILQKTQPDIVIVNGTRIIDIKVLNSIDAVFINTHVGITPRYRGVHGGYWSLVQNDKSHCGVTIHLVDSGIDTGKIIYQGNINPTKYDNFNTYSYLQLAVAIPLMKRAISDVIASEISFRPGCGQSKLWYHPTLFEYITNRLFNGVK